MLASRTTSASAAKARPGRSHHGGGPGAVGYRGGGGRSLRPIAKQIATRISESPAGGSTRLSAATTTRKAVQPLSTLGIGPEPTAARP
jgi:hypothetical protein